MGDKALILADIHLGVVGRLADTMWALDVVEHYANSRGIELVLSLGDTYHDRRYLTHDVLCASHGYFAAARAAGRKWVKFCGNHDMFLKYSWSVNGLVPLGDCVTVVDGVRLLEVRHQDGVCRFWILPFIHFESAYMTVLAAIEKHHREGDILLTHIGINGAILNTCFLLKDWSLVNFRDSKFTRIYTGHFHSVQSVGNAHYPGSLIPFKFDEGDVPHGFYVLDMDSGQHEFVDVWEAGRDVPLRPGIKAPPPQFRTVTDGDLDSLTDVHNCRVRIATNRDWTQLARTDASQAVLGLGARSVSWMDMTRSQAMPKLQAGDEAIAGEDPFARWLEADTAGVGGLQKQLLLRLNRDLVVEGDELYVSAFDGE